MPASSATRTASLASAAQRVDDPHQRDEHQIVDRRHRVGARGRHRRVVEVADGERQAPAGPVPTAPGSPPGDRRARRRSEPASPCQRARPQRSMTTSGAPLTVMNCGSCEHAARDPFGTIVERRHELVLGVERHLRAPRQRGAGLLGAHAHLRREHDERCFGRITDHRSVVADGGVAREHQAEGRGARSRAPRHRRRPGSRRSSRSRRPRSRNH